VVDLLPLTHEGVLTKSIKAATLHHPFSFAKNLLSAKSSFSKGEYRKAGVAAGKDVHFILDEANKPVTATVNELEDFTDHFWAAAFGVPLHLEECTTKSASSLKVIEKSIALIKDHSNPIEVAISMFYIKAHYTDIAVAYADCTKVAPYLI